MWTATEAQAERACNYDRGCRASETQRPGIFSDSSAATRACPHVEFPWAICTMSLRMLSRKFGPTSLPLPFPKQLEALAMPADQGRRFDMTGASLQLKRSDSIGSGSLAKDGFLFFAFCSARAQP